MLVDVSEVVIDLVKMILARSPFIVTLRDQVHFEQKTSQIILSFLFFRKAAFFMNCLVLKILKMF